MSSVLKSQLSIFSLICPCLGWERIYRQRFQPDRLVIQSPAIAEIQRMFKPLVIVTRGEIITGMGAAAFSASLGRNHGGHCHLHQIVELQSLHPGGIENSALVLDPSMLGALRHLIHFYYASFEHIGKPEYATICLHALAQGITNFGHTFAIFLAIETSEPCQGFVGGIRG